MFPFFFQKVCALDISDSSIELLSLENGYPRPRVSAYNRMLLPYGIARDGKLYDPQSLVNAIKKLMLEARPMPIHRGFCLFSLPDSQVFTKFFHLPSALRDTALRSAILHELESLYPIDLKEYFFNFSLVRSDKEYQTVFVCASPKTVVHAYVNVLVKAGLIPIVFDLETLSVGRALLEKSDRKKTILIADIGARSVNAGVFENNAISSIFFIPRAGMSITNRIASTFKISLNTAEKLKRECNIYSHGCDSKYAYIIEKELDAIIREIKKYIQYHFHNTSKPVDSIILCGGSALLPGIRKYFQSHFQQNVEIRNPLKKLSLPKMEINRRRSLYFANVVGLALRAMSLNSSHEGINLLYRAKPQSWIDYQDVRYDKVKIKSP